MERNHQKVLLDLANGSGFLFQLRVEDEIKGIRSGCTWELVLHEHHWRTQDGGEGYIDILAGYGKIRLVVECKKASGQDWLFLVPRTASPSNHRVRALQAIDEPNVGARVKWREFIVQPTSEEAAFCAVQGQDPKGQPMIERLADSLLPAMEAVALEELAIAGAPAKKQDRVYIPVVVTAATIHVARFDAMTVDLSTGEISQADLTTKEVPLVRFRKGLASTLKPEGKPVALIEANKEKERTILVIQARHLTRVLSAWTIQPPFGEEW